MTTPKNARIDAAAARLLEKVTERKTAAAALKTIKEGMREAKKGGKMNAAALDLARALPAAEDTLKRAAGTAAAAAKTAQEKQTAKNKKAADRAAAAQEKAQKRVDALRAAAALIPSDEWKRAAAFFSLEKAETAAAARLEQAKKNETAAAQYLAAVGIEEEAKQNAAARARIDRAAAAAAAVTAAETAPKTVAAAVPAAARASLALNFKNFPAVPPEDLRAYFAAVDALRRAVTAAAKTLIARRMDAQSAQVEALRQTVLQPWARVLSFFTDKAQARRLHIESADFEALLSFAVKWARSSYKDEAGETVKVPAQFLPQSAPAYRAAVGGLILARLEKYEGMTAEEEERARLARRAAKKERKRLEALREEEAEEAKRRAAAAQENAAAPAAAE